MPGTDELTFDALERFATAETTAAETTTSESTAAETPTRSRPVSATGHVNASRRSRSHTPAQLPAKPQAPVLTRIRPEKARFYRPELFSGRERFFGNLVVQIVGWTALVAGTVALLVFALTKFSG